MDQSSGIATSKRRGKQYVEGGKSHDVTVIQMFFRAGRGKGFVQTRLLSLAFYTSPPLFNPERIRTLMADVIISEPSPEKLRVLPHNQYQTPDNLSPSSVLPSPLDQFHVWFKEAIEGGVHEPEAMALSTATPDGIPSSRMVLFKQLDSRGFVFYTNYTSRKSIELESNPHAALVFYWREIHRSVRVVGKVEKVSREESEDYFHTRPVGSQLGAWASKQSTVVHEGEVHNRLKRLEERFGAHDKDNGKEISIPLPDFWGGWRVIPSEIEFWAGKPSRLHDRVRYLREAGSPDEKPVWKIDRLSP